MLPLSLVNSGAVKIVKIGGGCSLKRRLYSMGLRENIEIVVLSNINQGPLILKIDNLRIVIGRGIANKIFVIPIKEVNYNAG